MDPHSTSLLSEQAMLVVGLARNCERTIRAEVRRISECLRACRALYWLVVESDSTDKTLDVLNAIKSETQHFRFISMGSLRKAMPMRTERLAHCRNVYLDQLRFDPAYSNVDYVVVADLDGVNDLLTAEGFASCWNRSGWDVCTANQSGPYYDIWALRHPVWNPSDCAKQYAFLTAHNVSRKVAAWTTAYAKMITIPQTEDWIEVDSSFGGLAVYRKSALEQARYIGVDEQGGQLCEHVSLHSQLRSKGYKIFINPRLVNTAETPHSRRAAQSNWHERRHILLLRKLKQKIMGSRPRLADRISPDIRQSGDGSRRISQEP